MAWWNPFSWGGAGQRTDRAEQFKGWSGLENLLPLTKTGMQNADMGLKFYQDIMSGDPKKMAAAIAPETKVIQGQAEQQKKQIAEFAPRSGGTAAMAGNIDTQTLSSIQDLINRLRPQAASALTQAGLEEAQLGGTAASGLAANALESRKLTYQMQQDAMQQMADFFSTMLFGPTGSGGGGGGQ